MVSSEQEKPQMHYLWGGGELRELERYVKLFLQVKNFLLDEVCCTPTCKTVFSLTVTVFRSGNRRNLSLYKYQPHLELESKSSKLIFFPRIGSLSNMNCPHSYYYL